MPTHNGGVGIMDLEKVREFLTFSESLVFSDAARALHMSQSALSKHIRDLEGELQVLLVERGGIGGSNSLTPVGRRFVERAKPWLEEYAGIVEECRELQSAVPPARIQDMHCSYNVNSQLRRALEAIGITSGNFAYVEVGMPIRRALDQGLVDFALIVEPTEQMRAFSGPDLSETYGWFPLAPEPLCFLVGLGNPLAAQGSITLDQVAGGQILTIENSAFSNWQNATSAVFAEKGCTLTFKVVRDSPLAGGAFPIGPRDLTLCTRRFARYYTDLDVEDVATLSVEGFDPVVWPFLVYRRDTQSAMAQQVVRAYGIG